MDEKTPKTDSDMTIKNTIREGMVKAAVNFLRNPEVQASQLSHKRAFLLTKGLSNTEIDIALERASVTQIETIPSRESISSPPVYYPSLWTRINRYGSAIIILGIALYGLHRFYQLYIAPLIYGDHKRQSQISKMEEQLLEVNRSLAQLRQSVATIEKSLTIQKQQMNDFLKGKAIESDCMSPSMFIDIRSDIATVKSLLLNRHQFPDVPKLSPCIPTWQMNGETGKGEKLSEEVVCTDEVEVVNEVVENASVLQHSFSSSTSNDTTLNMEENNNEQEEAVEPMPVTVISVETSSK